MRPFWCLLLLLVGAIALTGADRSAEVEYAAAQPAELAGKTFMRWAARRILDRPEGTTVLELALANSAAAHNRQQQQPQQQQQKVDPTTQDWDSTSSLPLRSTKEPTKAPQKVATTTPAELLKPYDHNSGRHSHAVSDLELSFDGMSAFTNRFLVDNTQRGQREPASPGLAVGHGFILETAESILRVYDQESGRPLMPPLSLNTFLGLPNEVNRTSRTFGPAVINPTCWYDGDTERWFVVAITTDRNVTTGAATANFIDLAVSDDDNPTGAWKFYRILGANDGSGGTPDFQCAGGSCSQSRPRLAVWDDTVIIATEEFSLRNPASFYYGSNVYAIDKHALLRAVDAATTALVRTYQPGSARPSVSFIVPARQSGACRLRNTFLMATPEARLLGGAQNSLQLFSLTGTGTLSSRNPNVQLKWVEKEVRLSIKYSLPPPATQKPGFNPYGTLLGRLPQSRINPFDADMASVAFVNDRLYCTWGTALEAGGQTAAGVAWAVVDALSTKKAKTDGLLGLGGGNSLIYPHLAVRDDSRGVLAVSVAGPDYYPSAAYAVFEDGQLGHLSLAAEGKAVIDGFTGYQFPAEGNAFGWNAAALVDDEGAFWINSQYVAHPACTFEQYVPPAGDLTCFGTRSEAANWNTRISKVRLFGWHYY